MTTTANASDEREALVELLEDALSKSMRAVGLQPKQRRQLMKSMVPHFIEVSALLALLDEDDEARQQPVKRGTVRAGNRVIEWTDDDSDLEDDAA